MSAAIRFPFFLARGLSVGISPFTPPPALVGVGYRVAPVAEGYSVAPVAEGFSVVGEVTGFSVLDASDGYEVLL